MSLYKFRHVIPLVIGFLLVCIKSGSLDFIENSLWAEDGKIFVAQAYELGISSFVEPHAGYLHLWPRLTAYISTFLSLFYTPYIFFLGWFLSCCLAARAILFALSSNSVPMTLAIVAGVLVLLPPHTDEVYFNLTNAHWFLAVFLSLTMLFSKSQRLLDIVFVFLASLTGPFSIILAPFVMLRIVIDNVKSLLWLYVSYFVATTIQFVFLITSGRSAGTQMSENFSDWMTAIWTFFTFGDAGLLTSALAIGFWVFVFGMAVVYLKNLKHERCFSQLSLLAFAILVYVASLWAFRDKPQVLSPLGGGARYFFVPYVLSAVFVAISYSRFPRPSVAALILFSTSSFTNFTSYNRSDLYFHEYSLLHEAIGGFYVPIHPRWSRYPDWGINVEDQNEFGYLEYGAKLSDYSSPNGSVSDGRVTWVNAKDPQIIFKKEVYCPESGVLGIVIDAYLTTDGWYQIFWGSGHAYSEAKSFKTYRTPGEGRLVFALPKEAGPSNIRFDPPSGTKEFVIKRAVAICIGE